MRKKLIQVEIEKNEENINQKPSKRSKSSSAANVKGGENRAWNYLGGNHPLISQSTVIVIWLFVGAAVSCLLLYRMAYPFFLSRDFVVKSEGENDKDSELERILRKATMENKTVILTTLNKAWAEPNSMFEIFLEGFRTGNGTCKLLDHLVVVTLDPKAHARCISTHLHCYSLNSPGIDFSGGEAYFMTSVYLEMMWIRIRLLASILEMGYNFVFTDADILWLQNPFKQFYPDADFQIACDRFSGDSHSRRNAPNGGFNYVKSNNRTIQFYKFWYAARKYFPGLHDQDVLNKIKYDPFIQIIGLKIRFLDTKYISGFCQVSNDFNAVCTMHANCCYGLDAKIRDLKLVLEDWRKFMDLPPSHKSRKRSWSVPQHCRLSLLNPPVVAPKKVYNVTKNDEEGNHQ